MKRLFCAFETYDEGLRALTRAIVRGWPRDDLHIQPEAEFYPSPSSMCNPREPAGSAVERCRRWLVDAFGMRVPPGEPGTYRDAIRRGGTVVVVHVPDADGALRAAALMRSLGAFDVEIDGPDGHTAPIRSASCRRA